jgi:hypothetical protein
MLSRLPHRLFLMLMMRLAVISDQLHSTDHFSDGEKAQYLCKHNTNSRHLPAVHVSNGAEDGFGVDGICGRACGGHE